MGSALEAVLALKQQEAARQQQASENLTQGLQMLQNARQQAVTNQLARQLQSAQIENYQSEALKNAQTVALQQKQNDFLQKVLGGDSTGNGGYGIKSIKIGDVTLEKPTEQVNGGVPITDINSIQDANMRPMVQGVLDYRINPQTSTSLKSDQRQKLVEMASAIDPTYDQTQFPARQAFKKEITSGVTGKNVIALNTAIGHLESLSGAFEKLDKTRNPIIGPDIPLANKLKDSYLTQTGNTEVTNVENIGKALGNELERAFKGSQTSMTGVEDFKKSLKADLSIKQQEGLKKTVAELLGSRINAIDEQHKTIMGKPRDFSLLNDKSRAILSKLGIDPTTIDSVGGKQEQLPNGVTESDIEHTLKLHPEVTREELLKKLSK